MILPSAMTVSYPNQQPERYAQFCIEPLRRTFGVSIGNPLRRILLSSIEGPALCSVQIRDVIHEFSTLPGVRDDMLRLLLNLREINVKCHDPKRPDFTVFLQAKGPGEVRASQLRIPADVEVLNPDLLITELAEDGALSIEMNYQWGIGFAFAADHTPHPRYLSINSIAVDANFNPVLRVAYHVERCDSLTENERLILRIWTNGSRSPAEVLDDAVARLKDELSAFSDLHDPNQSEEPARADVQRPGPGLKTPGTPLVGRPRNEGEALSNATSKHAAPSLDCLNLSPNILKHLREEGIYDLSALLRLRERDLRQIPGFGERSRREVQAALYALGFKLS